MDFVIATFDVNQATQHLRNARSLNTTHARKYEISMPRARRRRGSVPLRASHIARVRSALVPAPEPVGTVRRVSEVAVAVGPLAEFSHGPSKFVRISCASNSLGNDSTEYNHAPSSYACPFWRNVAGARSEHPLEVIHRDPDVFVKMNPKWWPDNPGAVLVVPNDHSENVYDLLPELGTPIQRAVRSVALAMRRAFNCDGVSTRQHNEPGANQDVWHYHLHVFPRWNGDRLDGFEGSLAHPGELRRRADQLRMAWPQ